MKHFLPFLFVLFLTGTVCAYVCNSGTEGGLTVTMQQPPSIRELNVPVNVTVTLENRNDREIRAKLVFSALDSVIFPESSEPEKKTLTTDEMIPASGTLTKTVQIAALPGTFTAHYPVTLNVFFNGAKINVVYPVQTLVGVEKVQPKVETEWITVPVEPLDGIPLELRIQTVKGEKPAVSFRKKGDALQIQVDADPVTLQDVQLISPQAVEGLYMSYGWYVKKPGKVNISSNGHQNSTTYVAFDFADGKSLLMASSAPFLYTFHDPEKKHCGISGISPTTFTLVSGTKGGIDCAIRYRPLMEKPAAPGAAKKAGKFCVDFWNGRFSQHEEFLRQCAETYGLRDDLIFISHNWQRFHYDHRLPDVYPPNPLFGTTQEMKNCLALCRKYGWAMGVHLNVIDYYPDASTFSFENVTFKADGQPLPAYLNVPLDAQSYRLASHRAAGVMKQTLDEMNADGFTLDAVFTDVLGTGPWAAAPLWDRNGRFITQKEAVAGVANVFDTIRNTQNAACGFQTFTNSESAHDFLVGHLDGGDCQFMRLTRDSSVPYRWFTIRDFEDVTRIPWFDLVNHQKMILHGVGYSQRFEGSLGRELHGLESDEYISTEILTGHALMTDGFGRDVNEILSGYVRDLDLPKALHQTVRMYWLAQCVARELARSEILSVEFVGGDIHRVKVVWDCGMTVYVNQGADDWTVEGVTLPQFGFLARNPKTGTESMIYRHACGRVVERSTWKEGAKTVHYVNARRKPVSNLVPVSPKAQVELNAQPAEKLNVRVDWERFQDRPVPQEKFQFTFWLSRAGTNETHTCEDVLLKTVEGGFRSALETTLEIPADRRTGRQELFVSAVPLGADVMNYDLRLKMLATPAFYYRYRLGRLEDGKTFQPQIETDQPLYERLFPPAAPVDFGILKTDGGEKIVTEPGKEPVVTPLPD